MHVERYFIPGLGHQSYLVVDDATKAAAVVDPRRDVDIYLEAAARLGAHITHVLETHVHNDYVTGAREFATHTGATIVTAAAAGVAYEHLGVGDLDRVPLGELTIEVLATPGHTPDHLSYAVYERGRDRPSAVFTGGSMLVGSAGRTDLVSPGMTLTLTRQQYRSLRRLLNTLSDDVRVYPTHGAGSFCGATMADPAGDHTTIGRERRDSPAAHAPSEVAFIRHQLAGYGPYPAYYAYMGEINQLGPHVLGELPELPALAPAAVRQQLEHGVPLIDGRPREAFAREHVPGSFNIELDDLFGIYVGWLLPFNKPLMLSMEDDAGRREAVSQLIRVGYENLRGYLDGGVAGWSAAGYPTEHFAGISLRDLHDRWQRRDRLAVLDVRDETEWRSGHIPGAQHIHLGDLMRHLGEIPLDEPVVTICRTGHRAAMAASIVAALGRQVFAVQRDGVPDWIARGYPAEGSEVVPPPAASRETEHVHL
jgi:hydroxyacylglutathione hydrolase